MSGSTTALAKSETKHDTMIQPATFFEDPKKYSAIIESLAVGVMNDQSGAAKHRVAAQIMMGLELGMSPAAAVRGIHFVKGKMTLSADMLVNLARRDGWVFHTKHSDPPGESCTVKATHETEPEYEFTWTMAMANKAGLNKAGSGWQNYPWDMLYARAASHVARKVSASANGIYSPEEIRTNPETYVEENERRDAANTPDVKVEVVEDAEHDPLIDGDEPKEEPKAKAKPQPKPKPKPAPKPVENKEPEPAPEPEVIEPEVEDMGDTGEQPAEQPSIQSLDDLVAFTADKLELDMEGASSTIRHFSLSHFKVGAGKLTPEQLIEAAELVAHGKVEPRTP